MALVKLTLRVRDEHNRIRVQESREVSSSRIEQSAQEIAAAIQRSFNRLNSGVRSDK